MLSLAIITLVLGAQAAATGEESISEAASPAPTPCCTAGIVPAGFFEVEGVYSADDVRGNVVHTSGLTLKYSVTDWFQLQLATNNLFVGGAAASLRTVDGVAPAVKFVFNQEGDALPQFAVSAHGAFPTSADDAALQSSIDATAMFYASKSFGRLHLDATLGVSMIGLDGAPLPQGQVGGAATLDLIPRVGVAAGAYTSFGNAESLPVDGGLWTTLNWNPVPQIAVSAGVELGFYQQTRAFSVIASVAYVLPKTGAHPVAAQPIADDPRQMIALR